MCQIHLGDKNTFSPAEHMSVFLRMWIQTAPRSLLLALMPDGEGSGEPVCHTSAVKDFDIGYQVDTGTPSPSASVLRPLLAAAVR